MKRLLVNGLDPDAIRTAAKTIDEYVKHDKQREKILRKAAEEAVKTAYYTYRGAVNVEARKIENGWAIIASGERVCFIEFGAGMYALAHMNALADERKLGFRVEPGSWSMTEGMRTWADYEDHPQDYPYNQPARPGMYEAYKAIQRNIAAWAKESLGQ